MTNSNDSLSQYKIPGLVLVGLGIIYWLYVVFGTKSAFDSVDAKRASEQFLSVCIGINEGLGKPKECLNFYNEVAPKILSSSKKIDFLGIVRSDNFRDLHRGLQGFLEKTSGRTEFSDWPKLKSLDEIYGNQKPQ